ncbi:MAG: ChbG/HpnK family deacetylase [Mesorhizobium sp.]|uniref:polysaccharide deacetylase family protein n=1 Tax=Mesorhizobium sp. TaxID=1871066 RepID=UPI0011F4A788|nr:polysaccharide deacetylase family protein [Mesorhizobium sp.]TIP25876.1 MAG: ChbG/HpnK family deacetylase [Mesorhizobium sp.]
MKQRFDKKRVVIHEDDVGMSHGANLAYVELSRLGTCSSGSVMVPCPWFAEAADLANQDSSLDLGVHLTLTSEQRHYRWRPVTTPPRSAGLTDEFGYFWPDVPTARKAHPDAVEAELRAQLDIARAAGFNITHIDAHMGTAQMPEFTAIYRQIAKDYGIPAMLIKDLGAYNPATYAGDIVVARYDEEIAKALSAGELLFDAVLETPWSRTTNAETAYYELFRSIPEGLTFLSMHFNTPGDFESINPRDAHLRTEEYELFRTSKVKEWITEFDLEIVSMGALHDGHQGRS